MKTSSRANAPLSDASRDRYSDLVASVDPSKAKDCDPFGDDLGAPTRTPVTYLELRDAGVAKMVAAGRQQQQIRNRVSALTRFMAGQTESLGSVVREELGVSFDGAVEDHIDTMAASGMSERTRQDRLGHLLWWRTVFDELALSDTLPEAFAACLAVLIERQRIPLSVIARTAGITHQTLAAWRDGKKRPWRGNSPSIAAVERLLDVPAGTLAKRLPGLRASDVRNDATDGGARNQALRTDFQRRMSAAQREPETLLFVPTPEIQAEWRAWLEHKTALYLPAGISRDDTWRIKSVGNVGYSKHWSSTLGDRVCPTARMYWSLVASLLGFLCLPVERGGRGESPATVGCMAVLADPERVMQWVAWRQARSDGNLHEGIRTTLVICRSLCRPEVGYLWQRHDWGRRFPDLARVSALGDDFESAWRAWCSRAHETYSKIVRDWTDERRFSHARDPRAPIAPLLSASRPLDEVLAMIQRMESLLPPATAKRDRAVHLRDVLLMKLLVSNPLRVQHFSVMKWSPNGSGNLYKTFDGSYRLRFAAADFKNQRGAARETYDACVPSAIWPDIDRYLAEARPVLLGGKYSPYFIVAADSARRRAANPDGQWMGHSISTRVTQLTRMHMPNSPGFGPHAFRHLAATDFLKRHPRDYLSVAHLLHDELKTVIREYGHLSVDDGLRQHHALIESVLGGHRGT